MRTAGKRATEDVAAQVLAEAGEPLRVPQIVERAGKRLRTRSACPVNIVRRDIALAMIRDGDNSCFVRVDVGLYTVKEQA